MNEKKQIRLIVFVIDDKNKPYFLFENLQPKKIGNSIKTIIENSIKTIKGESNLLIYKDSRIFYLEEGKEQSISQKNDTVFLGCKLPSYYLSHGKISNHYIANPNGKEPQFVSLEKYFRGNDDNFYGPVYEEALALSKYLEKNCCKCRGSGIYRGKFCDCRQGQLLLDKVNNGSEEKCPVCKNEGLQIDTDFWSGGATKSFCVCKFGILLRETIAAQPNQCPVCGGSHEYSPIKNEVQECICVG